MESSSNLVKGSQVMCRPPRDIHAPIANIIISTSISIIIIISITIINRSIISSSSSSTIFLLCCLYNDGLAQNPIPFQCQRGPHFLHLAHF